MDSIPYLNISSAAPYSMGLQKNFVCVIEKWLIQSVIGLHLMKCKGRDALQGRK